MRLVGFDWLVCPTEHHTAATAGLRCGSNSCLARETHDDSFFGTCQKLNAMLVGKAGISQPSRWSPTEGFPQAGVGTLLKVSLK
jgi:hypothetical protein